MTSTYGPVVSPDEMVLLRRAMERDRALLLADLTVEAKVIPFCSTRSMIGWIAANRANVITLRQRQREWKYRRKCRAKKAQMSRYRKPKEFAR